MIATRLRLRDFRSYASADVALGAGLTVVHGRNGAGKTNLLEALYFGCTGRSCRTSNEREVVRFDAGVGAGRGRPARRRGRRAHADRGLRARRGEAPAGRRRDRRAHRRPVAPADLRVPARPPRARQGPAGAAPLARRPGRRGDVARPLGDAPRLRPGARAAQRAAGPRARRPRIGRARCRRGTPSSRATASRCATTAPPRSSCSSAALRGDRRARSASAARPSCATGRARGPLDAAGLAAELAEHTASDLERGFTGHGPAPRRPRAAARRSRAARVRLAGRAAPGAAGAAAGRARGAGGDAPRGAADAARRRHERARSRAPRAARADARRRGSERHHDDRPRRTCRAPTGPRSCASRSPTGPSCRTRWRHEPPRARARWAPRSTRSPGASRRRRCSATCSACGSRRPARRSLARPRRCPSAAGR